MKVPTFRGRMHIYGYDFTRYGRGYEMLDPGYHSEEVKGARVARKDIERTEPDQRIAAIVTKWRQWHNMTKKQLAKESGASLWTLYKIEGGQRGIGTVNLGKLGKVLGKEFEHEMLSVLSEGQ